MKNDLQDPQFVVQPANGQFLHWGPFRYVVLDTLDNAVCQLVCSEQEAQEWIRGMTQ